MVLAQKRRARVLRILFMAWRSLTLATLKEAWQSEALRLREMLGKRSDSIWHMNRAELVRKAQQELGMSATQCRRETVTTLREKLRRARAQVEEETDPLLQVPKGLERMNADTLVEQCILRGLDVTPLPGTKGIRKTRPQMIVAIREDVEVRLAEAAKEKKKDQQAASTTEGDWQMS